MNILLVCTGNTCRSAMAGGLFEKAIDDDGDGCISIDTAGINVYMPTPASENAVKVMEEMDIDLSDHMSKQVTKEDIDEADLVLVMTLSHRNTLIDLYPQHSDKIYTFPEYAYGSDDEISDPFSGDEEEYRECAHQLKDAIDAVIAKIKSNGASL
ncbi:MAG: low molecular weight protein arginine phosphatase [Clostridia bacterium]|nr:low molecular weight protein arginine phosphatase [Clostridia bacterium]